MDYLSYGQHFHYKVAVTSDQLLPWGETGAWREEPDDYDGSVLNEAEWVVKQIFVSGLFFFCIEKHEDINNTYNENIWQIKKCKKIITCTKIK